MKWLLLPRERLAHLLGLLLGLAIGCFSMWSNAHSAEVRLDERYPGYEPCSIKVEGKIEQGDFDRFARAVQNGWAQNCLIFEVFLSSPGGDVREAIKIGRLIRLLGAKTHAPTRITQPARGRDGCALFRTKPRGGCLCGSACVLIWSGGTVRSGEEVYVHRPYFTAQFPDPLGHASQQAYRDGFVLVSAYMREMNFPQSIIDKLLSTSSANMSQLTQRERAMVENDPVWEELEIRACGPRYGWRAVRRDKTLVPKAVKQSQCAERFLTEHLARLKPEARAYIRKVSGSSASR